MLGKKLPVASHNVWWKEKRKSFLLFSVIKKAKLFEASLPWSSFSLPLLPQLVISYPEFLWKSARETTWTCCSALDPICRQADTRWCDVGESCCLNPSENHTPTCPSAAMHSGLFSGLSLSSLVDFSGSGRRWQQIFTVVVLDLICCCHMWKNLAKMSTLFIDSRVIFLTELGGDNYRVKKNPCIAELIQSL